MITFSKVSKFVNSDKLNEKFCYFHLTQNIFAPVQTNKFIKHEKK